MNEGWNVVVRYDEVFDGVNVWFIFKNGEEETVVQPINLTLVTRRTPGMETPEPTLRFDGVSARQVLTGLAEGLVQAGYAPDSLKAKDKEVEAIREHLADMRKIVFEALAPPEFPPQLPKR